MIEPIDSISLEDLRNGNRESFANLVELTSARIYRTALQILGNEQDAEDVLQETYLKAMRAISGFEGRSSLSTWLNRIAVNEALMILRKRKPLAFSVDDNTSVDLEEEGEGMEIVDFCCLPEGELLTSESRKFMDQAIQRLPDTLRTVFVLRDLEGLSIQETAETLKLSENNVKVRLLRARLRLRKELSIYYAEMVKEEKSNE